MPIKWLSAIQNGNPGAWTDTFFLFENWNVVTDPLERKYNDGSLSNVVCQPYVHNVTVNNT